MKAAVVGDNGLEVRDVEQPRPGPDEVLVRVRACGLNRADAMVASGMAHGRAGGSGTVVGIDFTAGDAGLGRCRRRMPRWIRSPMR